MAFYNVAVVGATGAVGNEMLKILEERNFPAEHVVAFASLRSSGRKITFKRHSLEVAELTPYSFKGIDLALFSAGSGIAKEFASYAVADGAVVVDNSSAFRMDPDVPLVVPEVNPADAYKNKGIIANPNCSTIQMVVALKPLHDVYKLKRVVVSTYQAVSGTGHKAVEELKEQSRAMLNGTLSVQPEVYPHRIAFNLFPHIDVFEDDAYTKEEVKMIKETRKIMGLPDLHITATCVRVPVLNAHGESVNVEFENDVDIEKIREILRVAPGVKLVDDPESFTYPMPSIATGKDEVQVGRLRIDASNPNTVNMWIVADNLRKGAALNAVQIGELLAEKGLLQRSA